MPSSLRDNFLTGKTFWLMLSVLFLMEFARGMYVLSYLPLLPTSVQSISVGFISLCITLHFISDALMNFATGFLLRRFGTKLVLNIGFLLAVISLLLIVLIPGKPVYLLAAILLGIAVCPIWVVMLSSVSNQRRAKQMGYVYFAWLIGLLGGMILMNLLFKLHATWPSVIMVIISVVAWFIYLFVKTKVTYIAKKSLKAQLLLIRRVMKRHRVLFPGIVLQGAAIGMLVPILPTYALSHLHVTTFEYTYLIITGGIGCTISMLFISKWTDHLKRTKRNIIIVVCFLIYATTIFLLTTVTNFYIVLCIAFFIGLFYGLLLPIWNAFVAENIHEKMKEESWGVFNSLQGLGTMIGPLIGGIIADVFININYTIYFSSLSFIFLTLFYLIFFLKKRNNA